MSTSFTKIIKQGLLYPKNFMEGRLKKSTKTITDINSGEGALIEAGGRKVAVYKNAEGQLITLSPVCTHLGCIVEWNKSEKTWDCPCHGSKYEADGTLKKGPAKKNLERISLDI